MKNKFFLTWAAALLALSAFSQTSRVYFGTNKGNRIFFADLQTETGTLTAPRPASEAPNCGFIAIHPNGKFLYSTGIGAFKINPDGTLTPLNQRQTEGRGACHVNIDPSGQCLMAAYYGSGQVASFSILPDGTLSEVKSIFQHTGAGMHPQRQKGPHAHSVFPHPEKPFAYALDLGIDQIIIYRIHPETGTLSKTGSVDVPGGRMGPRHMKWSADGQTAYVLNELDLSLSIFKAAEKNGQLDWIRTLSVLPEGTGRTQMTCAEIRIHPSGQFIYASTRDTAGKGRDALTVFSRLEDGLQRIETIAAEVKVPRNFNIDPSGKWLLVAGQSSHDIAVFEINPNNGHLAFTGTRVPLDSDPICIEFLPSPE